MSLSVARVPTVSASRYLQQLAKHWSHKMPVVFTPEEGTIAFPNGTSLAMRADSESLALELTVPEGEDTGRMRTRKSVGSGKSVSDRVRLGGRRCSNKNR